MTTIHRSGLLAAGLVAFAALAASTGAAAADVGVSVSVNQPGFFGRIDINQPPPAPALIYAQPVLIAPPPVHVVRQPIYLRVPPGHEKHWGKHCAKYNACGQPVYFIRDNYYQQHYVVQQPPRVVHGTPVLVLRERDGDGRGRGRDRDDDDRGQGRGHDNDHGHGKGHGHGHGRH
jgi:hypothetical protein